MKGFLNAINNAVGKSYTPTAKYKRRKRKEKRRKIIKFSK